jgi:hypothetical protein
MSRSVRIMGLAVLAVCIGIVSVQGKPAVTIGGSYWRGAFETQSLVTDKTETKAGNLIGPFLNIRFDKWTLGSSMFFGSYDFSEKSEGFTWKLKRSDLNLSLGYSVTPMLTLFGAYKNLKFTDEYSLDAAGYYDPDTGEWISGESYSQTDEASGSFFGGGASVLFPFQNSPFFLYGSGAYLKAGDSEKWNDIVAWTAGLGLHNESGLSLTVGYRMDKHLDKESSNSEALKIGGITATLAYTLR